MAIKHSDKFSQLKPKKMEGHYQYTVISAVYNVERYLEDYFESFIKQRLDFKKHIQLILVDDGSVDNSASVIKRWQKKYPHNITYIYKENGGQASARNIGLKHVTTEWVTFIDPDDFVSNEYFLETDNFILKNNNLSMVACNLYFYYEDKKQFSNSHPLRFRFENDSTYPSHNLNKCFQLSASAAFFLTHKIKDNNLTFDDRIKPNFEDGHFIASYLSNKEKSIIGFAKKPIYYYRKRSDGTSTLDTSWEKNGRYSNVLEYGYLDMLKKYKKNFNTVPVHIQRTVLYDMIWHFKRIVNNPEKVHFLNAEQKKNYINLIDEVFKYIDKKTILDFELAGAWFYHKVGILACFKKMPIDNQIVYVEDIDRIKNLVQIRYFTNEVSLEQFSINGIDIYPVFAKNIKHDFLERVFVVERCVWIKFENIDDILTSKISGKSTKLSLAGKQHKTGLTINTIKEHFDSQIPVYPVDAKYKNAWLLMDRDTQADDNAEHLYRFITKNHPEQALFFVLSINSHDWVRLEKEKFNLIAFDSAEHRKALMCCSKIISSHADKYVTNYLGPKMLSGRHFIFLQHGVIKDDLSNWLNQKESIDCFITTTTDEYNSISEDLSRYKYSKKEVKLTGLPRHDNLIKCKDQTEKLIVIMPTWRKSIVGNVIGDGNNRVLNPDFMKTSFAAHWYGLLHSDKLKSLSEKSGYRIAFFPHANIQPYLDQFNTPNYIEVLSHNEGSIQKLFTKAALMITDYSSVAFEMAIQNKTSIYYQFDEDELFSGGHVYSKGYFDYRKDGFGPVVITQDALITELEKIIENNCLPSDELQERINQTYPFRDGRSCERTYEAIKDLDNPLPADFIDVDLVKAYAEHATNQQQWSLSESRWQYLKSVSSKHHNISRIKLAEALREQGKFNQAEDILSKLNTFGEERNSLLIEKALLAMCRHQWEVAIHFFRTAGIRTEKEAISYLRCFAELKMEVEFNRIDLSIYNKFKKELNNYREFWRAICKDELHNAAITLEKRISGASTYELISMHPQLLLAKTYCRLNRLTEANQQLVNYEKHTKNSPYCREVIALLAYQRQNWKKVTAQINTAYPTPSDTPEPIAILAINALQNQSKELASALNKVTLPETIITKSKFLREKGLLSQSKLLLIENHDVLRKSNNNDATSLELAKIEILLHNWQKAISHLEQIKKHDNEVGMARLRCLAELHRPKAIRRTLNDENWIKELPPSQRTFAYSLYDYSNGNIKDAVNKLNNAVIDYHPHALITHKPFIWLARCLREIGNFNGAHSALLEHEKFLSNDIQCREQIAKLAMARGDVAKAIHQIDLAYPDSVNLPSSIALILIEALNQTENYERASQVIQLLPENLIKIKPLEISAEHTACLV